jgi:hypothetical protein
VQVLLAATLVDALHAALEDRVVAFNMVTGLAPRAASDWRRFRVIDAPIISLLLAV